MIQILTLNTRLLPSFAYHHQTPIDQRADELADWILHTRCDVVCLQEVFSAKAARRLIARLGPYFAHISEPRAIRLEDDGLLIASRLPFARPATSIMWRDVAHLHEAAASKGATRVVIDLIDRGVDMRLALVNLHMHADYEGRSYAAVRLLQAGQLRESLLSDIALDRANEQWGLIAIGDFNVIAERDGVSLTPEYQLLVEHLGGPRDLYRDTAPPEPGPTCGDMRIDFAMAFDRSPDDRQTPLARLIALAAEVLEAPYSDHRGLLVTVGPATPPTGTLRGLIASSAGGADVATMSLLPFPIRNIEALIVRLIERLLAAVFASEPIAQHLPRPWPKPPNEERPSWSRISRPTTLAALRETVASALTHGRLKAIGADQSTSDVKTTTGLKLVMAGIASVDGPDDTNMLSFQGGATVKRLNAALQSDLPGRTGRALINQPGCGDLTFVGCMAVGGHGSGTTRRALASQVRALCLVGHDGNQILHHQIEPVGPEVPLLERGAKRLQDDALFRACTVNIGLLGVVSRVAIEVTPGFRIRERRSIAEWSDVADGLAGEIAWNDRDDVVDTRNGTPLGLAHSLELWVDPYSGKTVVGKRWRTTDPVRGARRFALNFDGWGTLESLMNELDEHDLMRYSPKIVAAALNLVVKDDDYVLTAATGLDFGANNGLDMLTSAVAVRADDCVAAVNAIRELCATMRSDNGGGLYLTSPIGVRFVKGFEAASRPWLAPQFDVPTAMIELAGFRQVRCSQGALSQTVKLLVDSFEARPHWGQYLPDWYDHSAIRKSYGDKSVTAFIEARRQLDPRGLFNNAFSERLRLDP